MSNKPELNISKEIRAVCDIVKPELKLNGNEVVADKDLFEKTLPDGLTMEIVKKVQRHVKDTTCGVTLAVGEIGEAACKKDKKLDGVTLDKFLIGGDSVRSDYRRKAEVRTPSGPIVKYGWVSTKFTSGSAGTSGAAFGRIRQNLVDRGTELFS